ncbi:ABC transporter permease [Caldivirga sp. MU80]|uniref:ABC transporter permease n=2 Tax=Caldivirga sp. MU80 TaxID=1650354 RepID=UPI00082C3735|nr:ABC transporter permease [Caldivirga sp. MU80]
MMGVSVPLGRRVVNRVVDFLHQLYVSIVIFTSTGQGKTGFGLTVFVVALALAAPLFPYPGPKWSNVALQFIPPTLKPSPWYILGADYVGAPLLLDIIWGLRYFLEIGVISAAITVGLGTLLGLLAGYLGGLVDKVLNFIFNIILTIPSFALWLILAVIFRSSNPVILGFIMGILSWAGLARSVRAAALSAKNRDYVEASRLLGLNSLSIIANDIMPALLPWISINIIMSINGGFYGAMGLAFLGLIPYSNINWGAILGNAFYQEAAIFTATGTIPALIITVVSIIVLMGFVMFANSLGGVFDPRLRREIENELANRRRKSLNRL